MKYLIFPICYMLVGMLPGCTPMKMSLSDDLKQDVVEYEVKGRQGIRIKQKLSFGDYSTTKVKRSWTRTFSGTDGVGLGGNREGDWLYMISMEHTDKKQTLNFSLQQGTNTSEVYTVNRFNAHDLHIGKNPNSILNTTLDLLGKGGSSQSLYYAQLFMNADERPWELVLDNQLSQTRPQEYVGYFSKSQSEYYTLVPVTKLDAKGEARPILMGSIGYEIKNPKGQTIAAVSLMEGGKVYLGNTSPEERFLMANLCTALLLRENIN